MIDQYRGTPAPVPAEDLAASLAEFGSSRMLPRASYSDPAVFEWERQNIFSSWICVGHASDLAAAGSQRAVDTPEAGVLLVRGDDDVIRAFANTCRHRAHELLPCGSSASRHTIVCPYHCWSYRLDGSLRDAPGFGELQDFDPSQFGLAPLRSASWHGWLFVDPSGAADDFDAHLAGLDQIVAPYHPETLQIRARHLYEPAANWKILVENYQECYHCSTIHPELCRVSAPTSGENVEPAADWMGGWMSLNDDAVTMSLDGRSGGVALTGLSEQELRNVMYVVAFPNLLISLHPDYVMTHLITPLAHDRTRIECTWAFPAEAVAADGFDPSYAVDFWDLTNRQDWAACESVQRGLRSPRATPGPLGPREDGVHDFVTRVARAYAGPPGTHVPPSS